MKRLIVLTTAFIAFSTPSFATDFHVSKLDPKLPSPGAVVRLYGSGFPVSKNLSQRTDSQMYPEAFGLPHKIKLTINGKQCMVTENSATVIYALIPLEVKLGRARMVLTIDGHSLAMPIIMQTLNEKPCIQLDPPKHELKLQSLTVDSTKKKLRLQGTTPKHFIDGLSIVVELKLGTQTILHRRVVVSKSTFDLTVTVDAPIRAGLYEVNAIFLASRQRAKARKQFRAACKGDEWEETKELIARKYFRLGKAD